MKKLLSALLLSMLATVGTAQAAFPDRPVKIITSLPVGSGPDVILRKIAEQLTHKWGQPVIIDNKPGGNGLLALGAYNKEPADGYTLFFAGVGEVIIYPILSRNEKISSDLEPVIPMMNSEMMLITSPKNSNLNELKEAFKKNPSYGSWGVASPPHFIGLELVDSFKVSNPVHVPYKAYGQWFTDTSSGQVTMGFATMASAGKLEKAGKLKFLAITGDKRDPDYPDVPTIKELTGKKISSPTPWVAFYVNKSAPLIVQKKLVDDITEVVNSKPIVDSLLAVTYKPWKIDQQGFKEYFANQKALYTKLINQHKISID